VIPVKIPEIPLPEPAFMITVKRGSDRNRRAAVSALRFLLWVVPSGAVDYVLATADGGRHSPWLTLAATFALLVTAVLVVNVRDGGKDKS
jgi:hypothetical protein